MAVLDGVLGTDAVRVILRDTLPTAAADRVVLLDRVLMATAVRVLLLDAVPVAAAE